MIKYNYNTIYTYYAIIILYRYPFIHSSQGEGPTSHLRRPARTMPGRCQDGVGTLREQCRAAATTMPGHCQDGGEILHDTPCDDWVTCDERMTCDEWSRELVLNEGERCSIERDMYNI